MNSPYKSGNGHGVKAVVFFYAHTKSPGIFRYARMSDMRITKEKFLKSNLFMLFPVIEVPYSDAIPTDWPGRMGIPFTGLERLNLMNGPGFSDSRFQILELKDDLKIDGKSLFKRAIIRNTDPDGMPDEFNVEDYFRRFGIEVEFTFPDFSVRPPEKCGDAEMNPAAMRSLTCRIKSTAKFDSLFGE